MLQREQPVTSSASCNGVSSSNYTGLSLDSTYMLKTKKIIVGNISKYFAPVSQLVFPSQIHSVEIMCMVKKKYWKYLSYLLFKLQNVTHMFAVGAVSACECHDWSV